ncbi:exosome component 2 [Nemania sp. FL0916]|nr:exosome component 2 [Nemania sp. FL0916]
MPITIIQPAPPPDYNSHNSQYAADSDSDSDEGGVDIEGDVSMGGGRGRSYRQSDDAIVTPGEIITEDPQWMRGHGTYTTLTPNLAIISSVAGTLSKTNKLLSVRPLRARYTPEIGDLVVGRIVEVQSRRWRVDVGASLLAQLPLSAINLPGGIQRRRTEHDELQIRSFFSEGELLVAEVQQLYGDGAAVLHTRSLKYGKLRNGVFVAVSGTGGGGGGVVRSRRQAFVLDVGINASSAHGGVGGDGGDKIDVILGVNGYIWISKHVEGEGPAAESSSSATGGGSTAITRVEESVGLNVYSSQNDDIPMALMREIARVRGVIEALVEHGLRVDEDMVVRGYHEAVELARGDGDGEETLYLGGERGRRLADALVGR